MIVSGANMLLSCADVDAVEEKVREATVVVTQLEIQPSVTLHALKLARKHGGMTHELQLSL